MVNLQRRVAEGGSNLLGRLLEQRRPLRVVLDEHDLLIRRPLTDRDGLNLFVVHGSVSELEAERLSSAHAPPLTSLRDTRDAGANELPRRAEPPEDLPVIALHLRHSGLAGQVPRRADQRVRIVGPQVTVTDDRG